MSVASSHHDTRLLRRVLTSLAALLALLGSSIGQAATARASDAAGTAISWARQYLGTSRDNGYCLRFVTSAYASAGIELGSPASAALYWQQNPKGFAEHPGDTSPPIGALVFWGATPSGPITYNNPDGHVGIYEGNNRVISTYAYPESATTPNVFEFPLTGSGSRNAAGYPYLGWIAPEGVSSGGGSQNGGLRPTGYNADPFGDLAIVHQRADGGADVHVLYGSTGTPFQYNPTLARSLPASTGWNWSQMKLSSGDYNGDGFSDIAIVHQVGGGGADVHILYGGAGTPFQYNPTLVRHLPSSSGWNWSQMQLVSGTFNADPFSDLAIVHQRADGGADVHVLYGSTGTPFQYNPTLARSLPASTGWNWSQMKLSSGDYNGDGFSDIAIVHQVGGGGADVHILYGGAGTPFQYNPTLVRHLPSSSGWNWSQMQLVSGTFNADPFSDLAIVHQRADGGADVHVLYGSTGTPFQYNPTLARSLPASTGWNWSQMKLSSGDYNGDGFSDIAIVHQVGGGGADVHILYGGAGTPFQYNPTLVRHLPSSSGWNWSQMHLASGANAIGS